MKLFPFYLICTLIIIACKKNVLKTDPVNPPIIPPVVQLDTTKPRLDNWFYIPANIEKGSADTFVMKFNKLISVESLLSTQPGCEMNLKYNSTFDSGKTVKFYDFQCAQLGGEFSIKYSVKDSMGNTLSNTLVLNCYTRKIITGGIAGKYFITNDNNYCWITTSAPNKILYYGINDTTIKKSFNLDFVPLKAVYNYYNDKIYIITAIDDYVHRTNLYVINPNNGAIEKTIPIPAGKYNEIQFAEDLAFGSNGYGMLKISNENSSTFWMVIDTQQNDSIYLHPALLPPLNQNSNLASFTFCFPNHDNSKIIALEESGNCRLIILDCFAHTLTEHSTPFSPHCYSSYIVVNKKKNDVFMVNFQPLDGQFIISNDQIVGISTSFDAYGNSAADFSYRPDESNYIYYLDGHVIGVVNYNTGQILMSTNFEYNLNGITATSDGKYFFSEGPDYLKIFDTNLMYRNF